ncbi:MAG: SDR family oxidoreductase [Acidisphaera sp.]|nr:SDR family oxidoreductase [Acidisphaera sp.]
MNITGSHAVVVGGSSGIGLAVTAAFVRGGARVTVLARDAERMRAALEPLGDAAHGVPADAAEAASIASALESVGAFDHLVVSAGGNAADGLFRDITEERFRAAFDAKFWVFMRALRLSLGRVRQSVTLVTGAAGRRAMRGLSGLAATNGALQAMIGPLALELAPVRINAVSPGLIDTPYWRRLPPERRDAMFDAAAKTLPVGRAGSPEDVADAVLFVAGNGFTTGAIIDCDGGARLV